MTTLLRPALAAVGLAAFVMTFGLASTLPTTAAAEVIVVVIDPPDTQSCVKEVDELRNKAKNVAGTALAMAHADEAQEACNANDFAGAEEALMDGYRWLGKKKSKGL